MPTELHIELAKPIDSPTISKIMAISWQHAYREILHDNYLDNLSDAHWVKYLSQGMAEKTLTVLVAKANQQAIGVAVLCQSKLAPFTAKDQGELNALYLLPEYIGHGLGHTLLLYAERYLKQQGYSYSVLAVLEDNQTAKNFYLAHGYQFTGDAETAVLDKQKLRCEVMRKPL